MPLSFLKLTSEVSYRYNLITHFYANLLERSLPSLGLSFRN